MRWVWIWPDEITSDFVLNQSRIVYPIRNSWVRYLVNTKTIIPFRVGEERWIYTSMLRVSVYIHHYWPSLRGIVVYYYCCWCNEYLKFHVFELQFETNSVWIITVMSATYWTRTLISAMPVQCPTSWSSGPTGSWFLFSIDFIDYFWPHCTHWTGLLLKWPDTFPLNLPKIAQPDS